MRAIFLVSVLAFVAPNREDPTPKVAAPTPQQLILGDWQLVKIELGGAGINAQDRTNSGQAWRITPTEALFLQGGKTSEGDGFTAKYSIDWSKNPIAIDLVPKQRGGKMPGILKLQGDQLIVAITTSGDTRPTDFTTAQMIAHYQRTKK